MPTQLDSRQVKKRIALPKLGSAAGATVESILDKINIEVDSPLRLAASTTPDALLNFAATLISAADLANEVVSPVKKQIFSTLAASTINFQTQAVSNAAYFDITWPTPNVVGRFRYAAFTLIGSGKIKVLFSAEATSEALLSNPGALFVAGGLPIGYVALECTSTSGFFKTAGSATNIIENAKIYRLAAGGGASSSSSGSAGGGGELVDLLFNIQYNDSFVNIPDGTTTVDVSAGFTDPSLHDVANELFRISYDASKTVSATGTAVTISSAPTFTVKIGDIINIPGTDSPKKITAVASQTSVTVESAWTVNPAAAACNISQAIHTQDLNAFTAGGTGLAASSQYSGNIDEIMIGYEDTTTLGDIIPDFGSAAVIAFSASSDSTNWTTAAQRVASLSSQELASVLPTSSTQLRLRFFSNATSGSGSVNLLAYKVFFQKVTGGQIGSTYNTAFARPTTGLFQNVSHSVVGGKSRFQFTFGYPRGNNSGEASGSALEVYANGQRVPRFVSGITPTTEAYFTEDSGSVITMDTDYSAAGIDFQFVVNTPVIDSNTNNTTQIASQGDSLDQKLDAEVVATYVTPVNGTPAAGQFRSDITNRASMVDLSNTLALQMGSYRIVTQDLYMLPAEAGSASQQVYGVVNDRFNQVRFVGGWTPQNALNGALILSDTSTTSYIEVVAWCTGLALLSLADSNTRNLVVSVDGGAEGSNLYVANLSSAQNNRGSATYAAITVASGLTLGYHTFRIRNNAAQNSLIMGFDILTETTSLRVASGSAVKGRYKNILSAIQTVTYNTGFESGTLGTRGGRALVYTKQDGTVGKSVFPTNAASAFLTSSDHTNEDMIRKVNWREFGANRSDDFSTLTGTGGSARAWTLDDNITTLVASNIIENVFSNVNGMNNLAPTNFFTFTWEGTGLDVMIVDSAAGSIDTTSVSIDGAANITLNATGVAQARKLMVCSGLPFGTHTAKFTTTVGGAARTYFTDFLIYQPKKPALPAGAIEIGEYNINADYVASATSLVGVVPTGTVRNMISTRGAVFTGTWASPSVSAASYSSGQTMNTTTSGSTVSFSFFGTGFEWRAIASAGTTNNASLTVDGASNLSGFTTSLVQASSGMTFTAATGVLAGTNAADNLFRVQVSGLALGWHTLKWTTNSAVAFWADVVDVICPTYMVNSNTPYDVQNTLLGGSAIGDLRKFNKRDIIQGNSVNIVQAFGIASSPTSSSTSFVPVPDMNGTIKVAKNKIRISFTITFSNNNAPADNAFQVFVDGIPVGTDVNQAALVVNNSVHAHDSLVVNVGPGAHNVMLKWKTSAGTMTALGARRSLLIEEVTGDI